MKERTKECTTEGMKECTTEGMKKCTNDWTTEEMKERTEECTNNWTTKGTNESIIWDPLDWKQTCDLLLAN